MAEKIIIDGVDVSGCKQYEHLLKDRSFLDCDCKRIMTCNGASAICKGYNCYFKQLARKTEECEKYKKQFKADSKELQTYFENDIKNQSYIEHLENELQAEKQKLKELEEKYKWYDHYKDSALYNKDLCNKKSDEIDKYKQALEEIKEIAHLIHFSTLPLHRGFTHDKADEIDAYLNKILQKCEVLNENEPKR